MVVGFQSIWFINPILLLLYSYWKFAPNQDLGIVSYILDNYIFMMQVFNLSVLIDSVQIICRQDATSKWTFSPRYFWASINVVTKLLLEDLCKAESKNACSATPQIGEENCYSQNHLLFWCHYIQGILYKNCID